MRNEHVFSVRGDAELVARAGHLFASARNEFVCAARDLRTWSQPAAREAVRARMSTAYAPKTPSNQSTPYAPDTPDTPDIRHTPYAPGLTVRKLLSPVALADEEARAHLRQVRGAGALVRISGSRLPHETILIDRRVMILAGRETPAGREYTVTTLQTLVDGVHSMFRALWDTALDLDTYLRGDVPHLDAEARVILGELASGRTDVSAARRLGVSLRTYRRRVAELMTGLEADSRFQAGVRAGELGLTPGRE
ncbi:DNA-binding response regulator [Streptomyces sp. NPDC006645]|uniref:DNA-binding response regulator n=1 Tax=unclassified Streptomyces TaxID=2593676 RepID=UPI0033A9343F